MIATWLTLILASILAVGSMCFLVGQLFERTNTLERTVKVHKKAIQRLSSKIHGLEGKMCKIQKEITGLRGAIDNLVQEIRKSRPKE